MVILTLISCLCFILTLALRRNGVSRVAAFGLSTLPALGIFIYYAIRFNIEIGPHGGIVPAWAVAGIMLLIVSAINLIAIHAVRGSQPE
jgi:hypothetical protein